MSTRTCAPRPHARSRPCRFRSGCSNILPPTACWCRRRCLLPRRSTPDNGEALLAGSDEETRRFVETLHPELAPTAAAGSHGNCSVERLRRMKRLRRQFRPGPRSARSSPGSNAAAAAGRLRRARRRARRRCHRLRPSLFRWECGPSGEIAWVDGAPRGPLIGRSIARAKDQVGEGVDQGVARAFAVRAPFRDATFMLARGWVAGGRVADQRSSRVRAGRRALRRLSRDRASRCAGRRGGGDRERAARRSGFAARAGSRDQDAAQRDHRLRRNHRRPISRAGRPPLPRARRARLSPRHGCC